MSSKFIFYSLAMVAEDILENEFVIKAFPVEILPDNGGELVVYNKINENIKTPFKKNINAVVEKDKLIEATWLPLSSPNRITPPMVCKGETIMLYNYAGTDLYYWSSLDNEMDLRKNEKVTYFFSNKKTIESEGLLNKSYYFTIDCINKFIRLFTNNNDGEYTSYCVNLDTKAGRLLITDGKGNSVEIDSENDKLTININKEVEIKSTSALLEAKEKIIINTEDATINAKNSVNIKTNSCTIDSKQCNIN